MSKAFDSVNRPLIVLCWQRLGLPHVLAEWLVALDSGGLAIARMDYALNLLDISGRDALLPHVLLPAGGTGLGDIHSPSTRLPVFAVLICLSERDPDSVDLVVLPKPDERYVVPGMCAMLTNCNLKLQLNLVFSVWPTGSLRTPLHSIS